MQDKRKWILLGCGILAGMFIFAGAALLLPAEARSSLLDQVNEARIAIVSFLESIPAPLYFVAFAVLPAFGMPLSFFYLTALSVLGGTHLLIGLSLAWLALLLNMLLTRFLAHGVFLPVIEAIIRRKNMSIPRLRPDNELKVVVTLRVSPLPFALQNYILALGHAGWKYYLWLSLVIQGAIGVAVMVLGESILQGSFGYALLGICLFLALNLALQSVRKRYSRNASENAS